MNSEDLLYDHYKDTFNQQKEYLAKREKYTYALIAVIILWAFQMVDNASTKSTIELLISNKINGLVINFKYIEIGINLLFLLVAMTYFQVNLTVERTYSYLHQLENRLSQGQYTVKREGLDYLESYPWLLSFIHIAYVVGLPVIILVFSIVRILHEWGNWNSYNIINSIVIAFIIVVTMLYISNRLMGEKYWNRILYPDLAFIGRLWFYFNPRYTVINRLLYKFLCLFRNHGIDIFPSVYQTLETMVEGRL